MQEKKEFLFLLIFILLSLLLHLGLAFHYRAWEPAAKALTELRRKQKNDIPVRIIELPPKEKKKEKPKPPPKKPSFLADRNQQTKTETRTAESAPKAVKMRPVPKKPAPPKPAAKPRPKVKPAPQPKPETEKRPQTKPADKILAAEKKAVKKEAKKKTQPDIKKTLSLI
ncbi:MAG TPA: hypothetical protein EYP64_06400 [Desulfarculaceae bacterium]|nr:hypothetical protein [Desulfarculaceae bacterium]